MLLRKGNAMAQEEFFRGWRDVAVKGRDDDTLRQLDDEVRNAEQVYDSNPSQENDRKLKEAQGKRQQYALGE